MPLLVQTGQVPCSTWPNWQRSLDDEWFADDWDEEMEHLDS